MQVNSNRPNNKLYVTPASIGSGQSKTPFDPKAVTPFPPCIDDGGSPLLDDYVSVVRVWRLGLEVGG